jgi:hypothetical protein
MRRQTPRMSRLTALTALAALSALAAMTAMTTTSCRHNFGEPGGAMRGEKAQLFKSVDEDLKPVDMKALIDGRPLVLVVGSAS